MDKKTSGVMDALKTREGFISPKKGVNLLGIVQKLTAKREEAIEKEKKK